MIIDMHTHIGKNEFVHSTDELLLRECRRNGVSLAVVSACGDNPLVRSHALREHDMLLPFFRFDPKIITRAQLESALDKFRGIKLHPRVECFDPLDKRYEWIFEMVQKHGLPAIVHTRKENNPYTDPDRLIELADRYPGIPFVFAHFANACESFFHAMDVRVNLFVDTSIVSSPVIIEMIVKKYGSKKILFGSDYPYGDQELELQKILRARIAAPQREDILAGNALRVLQKK